MPIGPVFSARSWVSACDDEVALVLGAAQVTGRQLVTVPRVAERLCAIQPLRAGLEVRAGVAVVHRLGNVDLEPAHVVHHADEAVEVRVDRVRNLDADRVADRLGLQRGAAVDVRRVDLVRAVARDREAGVAREVEDRRLPQRAG